MPDARVRIHVHVRVHVYVRVNVHFHFNFCMFLFFILIMFMHFGLFRLQYATTKIRRMGPTTTRFARLFQPRPNKADSNVVNAQKPALFSSLYGVPLKGLSHKIFGLVFGAVWVYLGLNVNRLWFLNFNNAPSILDNYFKF